MIDINILEKAAEKFCEFAKKLGVDITKTTFNINNDQIFIRVDIPENFDITKLDVFIEETISKVATKEVVEPIIEKVVDTGAEIVEEIIEESKEPVKKGILYWLKKLWNFGKNK